MKLINHLLCLTLVSSNSIAQTAEQVRKDIDKTEVTAIEHGAVPAKCGDFLAEYVKTVDELLALSQRRAKEGDKEEIKTKMKAIDVKMEALSKKMKENVEVFTDTDCSSAWINAQQKYSAYIQQNMGTFMHNE